MATQEAVQISAIVPTLTVDDSEEHQILRSARLRDRRAVGGEGDAPRRDDASGHDPDRLEPGRFEEGAPNRKKGIGVRVSISTSTPGSVDEIAKRAKNAGITLKSEPRDTEWESRAFELSDPSGYLLTVYSDKSGVGRARVTFAQPAHGPEPWCHASIATR